MFAREYVADLAARGRHHFTTDEAVGAIGSARSAVRGQLRRLKARGVIAEPVRGFNMIVPVEAQESRLPAGGAVHSPVDGSRRRTVLLRPAQRGGALRRGAPAAAGRPGDGRARTDAAVECGQVRVEFVARHDLDRVFVREFNTPRGIARLFDPRGNRAGTRRLPEARGRDCQRRSRPGRSCGRDGGGRPRAGRRSLPGELVAAPGIPPRAPGRIRFG